MANTNRLPEAGYVRLSQILGDKKRNLPPIIPVGKTSWYEGIKAGKYPPPIKLGPRTSVWRAEDIRALLESFKVAA
jgi:prophage regulatory protein